MFGNRRIMDLYDRVFKLEGVTGLTIFEVKEGVFGDKMRCRSSVPIDDAVRLILNHLGLELKRAPVNEEFQLVKKEE